MPRPLRRANALFALGVLAFPLVCQGTRGLLEPDEGRYAECAREMLATGDWLVPRLAGQPHFTKPPLTYWLTAGGLALAGRNAFGARLPLGLAAGATALLCGLIARRFWGPRAFRTGAALLLLALVPFVGGGILTTDTFLTLWETAAVLCCLEAWAGGPAARRWAAGAGMAFGLAFLTKGPPGLLPLAAFAVFAAWRGAGRWRRLWSPWGVAAGLALGLGWYGLVMARTPGLGRYFLENEVYARVFTTEHHRGNPWLIHPAALLVGLLPWTVALPWFAGGWGRTWRRVAPRLLRPADDRARWLLLWFALPLAVFLMARSRLPLYMLPLFVPLCVAGAGLLHGGGAGASDGPGRGFWRFAAVWAAALIALKFAAGTAVPWRQDMRALASVARAVAPAGARVIAVGEDPLHGLRFYRDGELTNWQDGPPAPPGRRGESLASGFAAARAAAAADGLSRVFIVAADAAWARPDLAAAGLRPAATSGGRILYVVPPPTDSPGTGPTPAATR